MKFRSYLVFFIISFFCLLSPYSYGTDEKTIEVKMEGEEDSLFTKDNIKLTDTLHQLKKQIKDDIINKLGDDFEYYFLDKLKKRAEDHFLIKKILEDDKIYIKENKKPEAKKERKPLPEIDAKNKKPTQTYDLTPKESSFQEGINMPKPDMVKESGEIMKYEKLSQKSKEDLHSWLNLKRGIILDLQKNIGKADYDGFDWKELPSYTSPNETLSFGQTYEYSRLLRDFKSLSAWTADADVEVPGIFKIEGSYESGEETFSKVDNAKIFMTTYSVCPKIILSIKEENIVATDDFKNAIKDAIKKDDFQLLLNALNHYGFYIPTEMVLGGKLYSNMDKTLTEEQTAKGELTAFGSGFRTALDDIAIGAGGGFKNQQVDQKLQAAQRENLSILTIGGDPGLVNNPSKWVASLANYENWKVIGRNKFIPTLNFISEEDKKACIEMIRKNYSTNPLMIGYYPDITKEPLNPFEDLKNFNKIHSVSSGKCIHLAEFKNKLHLVYRHATDGAFWSSSENAKDWSLPKQVSSIPIILGKGGFEGRENVVITEYMGKLCMAVNNIGGQIELSCSSDGMNWSAPFKVEGWLTHKKVAMEEFNGRLYLFHNSYNSLLLHSGSSSDINLKEWSPVVNFLHLSTKLPVSLKEFDNHLIVAFVDSNDNQIKLFPGELCLVPLIVPKKEFTLPRETNIITHYPPVLEVVGNVLCLAYINPNDNAIMLAIFNGKSWDTACKIENTGNDGHIALKAFKDRLYLAFSKEDGIFLSSCKTKF